MKRNQWTASLLAVLLFCCGAAAGALAERYYSATVVNAKTAEDMRQQYVSEMRSRLHLSRSQVDQLQGILDDTKARYKAVRDSYHPQMLSVRNEQISRVKSILTPQQVPAYEQLIKEREQRARAQEERDRMQNERKTTPPASR